jgi:Uma2 family endonuclease
MLLDLRLISVAEYHSMGELGILNPDENVELLAGQIVKKSMKGTRHTSTNKRLEKVLEHLLGDRALVRTQDPITLDNYSEPEPDVAVVLPNLSFYADHHPTPSEVYLIIEISDTTLRQDCEYKAKLYAQAAIEDYWVLDINKRQLHIFRLPSSDGYLSQQVISDNEIISPLAFPEIRLSIADLW